MANGLELLRRYVEQRNEAVEAFISEVDRIKTAIEKDRVRGRSPVKLVDEAYKFTLLNESIRINSKEEALQYLADLKREAYDENDAEFRAAIEAAYASAPSETEAKPKRKYTRKAS